MKQSGTTTYSSETFVAHGTRLRETQLMRVSRRAAAEWFQHGGICNSTRGGRDRQSEPNADARKRRSCINAGRPSRALRPFDVSAQADRHGPRASPFVKSGPGSRVPQFVPQRVESQKGSLINVFSPQSLTWATFGQSLAYKFVRLQLVKLTEPRV